MQLPVLAELCIWPTHALPPGSLSSLGDPPVVTLSLPMENASLEGTAQVPGTTQCSSAGKGWEITQTCEGAPSQLAPVEAKLQGEFLT